MLGIGLGLMLLPVLLLVLSAGLLALLLRGWRDCGYLHWAWGLARPGTGLPLVWCLCINRSWLLPPLPLRLLPLPLLPPLLPSMLPLPLPLRQSLLLSLLLSLPLPLLWAWTPRPWLGQGQSCGLPLTGSLP